MVLETKGDEPDSHHDEPIEEEAEPNVPREIACDAEDIDSQPTLGHDEEPSASSTLDESDAIIAAKLEVHPPSSSPEVTSHCIAASLSPVRRRIHELEQRIAVCPTVPVPDLGVHDFSRSSDASSNKGINDAQEVTDTVVEKCDNDELADLIDKPGSEIPGDVDSVLSMDLLPEHKEILRTALAQLDSLPSRPGQTLETFLKCRSFSQNAKESFSCADDNDNDDDVCDDDDNSAALEAVGGQYEEGSIDESYSAWSNSVDSSLVSRYSLLSRSNGSLMTTKEAQQCQTRAKIRLRRRQKARLRRSLKKLAVISLAMIFFLYWVESKSQKWLEGTTVGFIGFFGILQFVVALLTLVKIQILWKKSEAIKIENGSCPFLDTMNQFFVEPFKLKKK
jgi:hypothetical protein